jgi:hypothetical protein
MMRRFISVKLVAAIAAAMLPVTANAAVTYQFTSLDLGQVNSFSFTVASPITADTVIPMAALANCGVDDPAVTCLSPVFKIMSGYVRVETHWKITQEVSAGFNFASDAFTTKGTHQSSGPVEVMGTLVVSGIGVTEPAAVPEPASWALMIGGFGLAGAALRRRSIGVRFASV